jgi:neuron navigator 2
MQIDNIKACLTCLGELGVSVDGVQAQDVRQGNLKAILGLFFSLSRHKQQQKHLTRQSEAMPRYEAMSLEGSATYLLTEQHNS